MRGATPGDADRLSDYNAEMHMEPDEYPGPAFWIGEWTRDLLTKPHPRMKLDDVIIVEDSASGQIVSSTVYFDQVWSYCGIPVPVGRPEIVSTHPDFRNRGLVRKQFELLHRWGDERGHLVQGITGIPYYYRQFGYEMALEMPHPRTAAVSQLPKWKPGESPTVQLRLAKRSDMPDILRFQSGAQKRALFTPDLTSEDLEYQLFDRDPRSATHQEPWIIGDSGGQPVGYVAIKSIFPLEIAHVFALEFADRGMFRAYTEPFLKSLRQVLIDLPEEDEKPLQKITVELHEGNPATGFLGDSFHARGRIYAWYVRTPELPKLLMLTAPKIEERLAGSDFDGLTGEKLIGFYRSGLRMKFEGGRLAGVAEERMPDRSEAAANFPDLTFLQMLFGRKTFGDLTAMFVDAYASKEEDVRLMDTLFPVQHSEMMFALS